MEVKLRSKMSPWPKILHRYDWNPKKIINETYRSAGETRRPLGRLGIAQFTYRVSHVKLTNFNLTLSNNIVESRLK